MTCPRCQTLLQEVTKTGVLIDLCPACKGVWLDRGELEKIIGRAREVEREWEEEQMRWERRPREYDDDRYEGRAGKSGWHRKKRWTEIFDIFD
ncbi:MAG: zf-TFIIB domain-containing protein [Thermodesulfobacteriota bacterium]